MSRVNGKIFLACLLLSCGVLAAHRAPDAQTANDTVMRVGDRAISRGELNRALEYLPPPQRAGYEQHPQLAANWYGRLIALSTEARREHLDSGSPGAPPEGVRYLDGLSGLLIQKIAEQAVPSEAAERDYYLAHRADFEQVQARHILISHAKALYPRSSRSALEAREFAAKLVARLRAGADFETVAREQSDDASGKSGGEFAPGGANIGRHQTVPAVDRVLFTIPLQRVSGPIETAFGYEIVRVEHREIQSFADARGVISTRLKSAMVERRIAEIVGAAHIRVVAQAR